MNKKGSGSFLVFGVWIFTFLIFTLAAKFIDVRAIGPLQSEVGLASLNGAFFNKFGENALLYKMTQIMGYIAIVVAVFFALVGLMQLIKARSLTGVSPGILAIGATYIALGAFYILFEKMIINYRPILEDGVLEASYPSSHTMLIVTITITAMLQVNRMIDNKNIKIGISVFGLLYALTAVIGRMFSGVHWFTDIIGGVILSISLIVLYFTLLNRFSKMHNRSDSSRYR